MNKSNAETQKRYRQRQRNFLETVNAAVNFGMVHFDAEIDSFEKTHNTAEAAAAYDSGKLHGIYQGLKACHELLNGNFDTDPIWAQWWPVDQRR